MVTNITEASHVYLMENLRELSGQINIGKLDRFNPQARQLRLMRLWYEINAE